MAQKKEKEEVIEIKPLDIQRVAIRIVGDTPLIVHAWSEKAKKMMLDAQMKIKTVKKERDPFDDFMQSMYWLTKQPEESTPEAFDEAVKNGAKWGFPVSAIKMAANSAAYRKGYVKNQMGLRGAYFLCTEYGEMAEIKGTIPEMREDMVRLAAGSADLRYRAEYKGWYMDLILEYDANGEFRLEDLINFINLGGYTTGIGEWRPEKDGTFGKYHVETM